MWKLTITMGFEEMKPLIQLRLIIFHDPTVKLCCQFWNTNCRIQTKCHNKIYERVIDLMKIYKLWNMNSWNSAKDADDVLKWIIVYIILV